MYQQNQGARSAQEETLDAQSETFGSDNLRDNSQRENNLSQVANTEEEALSTRTAERWWLRKRLMQG